MKKYNAVATGGTFDIIHKGHIALLSTSFRLSNKVIIGLTSDDMAKKKGKKILHTFEQRLESLKNRIEKEFPGSDYVISKLENDFGPAVFEDIDALIVSEETKKQGDVLNELRKKRQLPPVDIVVVPLVTAKDSIRISSTRIRNNEIDPEGNIR